MVLVRFAGVLSAIVGVFLFFVGARLVRWNVRILCTIFYGWVRVRVRG